MTEKAGSDIGIDRRLLHLASDPVRLDALVLLNESTADAGEVAEALGVSSSVANHHLEEMHEVGLIEVVTETSHRGAAEPRYRALVRALWSDEEWAALGREERRRLSAWIVRLINSDVEEALESGSFDARDDGHASRTASIVDEQGWRELTRIQAEALEASFMVQAASAERLAERGEKGTTVMSAMLCFEMPRSRRD